ncbi:MAG: alkaline phosphatase PhoX [Gemmatimonadota bacterium]
MTISRREFLGSAAAISLGFQGIACARPRVMPLEVPSRFGPLVDDPAGIIALPEGFSYRLISRGGERMNDGFFVPTRHDGMATFAGPNGTTVLVRNHEMGLDTDPAEGAFGADMELLSRLDADLLYDAGGGDRPALGGTTTIVYDTERQSLVSHHLSLAGTLVNCAGGPTPWGSWISCEETTETPGSRYDKAHGYNFEVPALGSGVAQPRPLVEMGRFVHEAIAVDPVSGVVYQTEDLSDGLLYRFIPNVPGQLHEGGRLQALAVRDSPSADLRNFGQQSVTPGRTLVVDWIDMWDPESPDNDLRYRGFEAGAARFARGEGIFYGERDGQGEVYIACTNGGPARKGQIWRYRPSPVEGTPEEWERPATLELFVEPNDGAIVENADNLAIAPWGDLFVCEDGTDDDRVLVVTPDGRISPFAHNLNGNGEFAGACFSPDGSTFFVNMQTDAWTVAITGPWNRRNG